MEGIVKKVKRGWEEVYCGAVVQRALVSPLDWGKGAITMAGVFGKDPNMNKAGGHKELDRVMGERLRKKAEAAARFLQKKPATSSNKAVPALKK